MQALEWFCRDVWPRLRAAHNRKSDADGPRACELHAARLQDTPMPRTYLDDGRIEFRQGQRSRLRPESHGTTAGYRIGRAQLGRAGIDLGDVAITVADGSSVWSARSRRPG